MRSAKHCIRGGCPHAGYTLAKMGMSFLTLSLAAEFGSQGVAALGRITPCFWTQENPDQPLQQD